MPVTHTTRAAVSTQSVASPVHWGWRTSVRASSSAWRLAGGGAVLIAIAATLDPDVALATGVGLALLVPPALVDVIDRRLPNRLVLRAGVGAIVVGLISTIVGGLDTPWFAPVGSIVLGGVALAGPLLAMHLLSPRAMGLGDVKAAIVAGAALGAVDPVLALVALAIASATGAIAGIVRQRSTIAFGPALVGGSIAAVVLHASSALGAVQ